MGSGQGLDRRVNLIRGSVVLATLDPALGHEQKGARPCIVVSDPEVASDQRFPMICLVPLTGTPGVGALYPPISSETSGLRKQSYALVDQLRSVDKRRISRLLGTANEPEMGQVDIALSLLLKL